MTRNAIHKPNIGLKVSLAVTTALATFALAGCTTTSGAPRAETSFGKAQVALGKGHASNAVTHAEAAVLADPRNPTYRATLGAAYLEAGRFQSAATSFGESLELGDSDPRTVLSYALAQTALGNNAAAIIMLNQWQDDLDPADYGLALSLAGQPQRGVHVLSNALRAGQNTPKVRQNLAYSYALAGNWRAARIMAAEDVPADKVGDRIAEWASMTHPEAYQARVADLIGVKPVQDSGQPGYLALANFPGQQQMVAQAAAEIPATSNGESVELAASQTGELPASAQTEAQTPAPEARFAQAFSSPRPSAANSNPDPVSRPVMQPVPTGSRANESHVSSAPQPGSHVAPVSSQRRMAPSSFGTDGSHLVQLGSFASRAGAERAWAIYLKQYPQLSGRDLVISQAEVRGKTYFRVSAAGFDGAGARSMCAAVRSGGSGCFAWAKGRPLPGAIDRGVRVAAR